MKYKTIKLKVPVVREASNQSVRTPEDCYHICKDIGDLAQETFQVLNLNAKNMLICRHLVTVGLLDASLVHPREVFRSAIENNAAGVILIHNHPSGDTTASADDIRITKQMIDAGRVIDIKVLDHVIIGRQGEARCGYLSMREEGICKF